MHETPLVPVTIDKLVEGGQGLGSLPDGKKVFVWNALPGEKLHVRIIRQKSSYAEAVAEVVTVPSPDRTEPLEANYLATSPWQIVSFPAENTYKHMIVDDIFRQAHMSLPTFQISAPADAQSWNYRNKIEYGFWGDDAGLHLAAYRRGSHGKQIITGSVLAMPALDGAARMLSEQLNLLQVRAGDLKTIIVRCSQRADVALALYVKLEQFPKLTLPNGVKGLRVYHSNPKSPASVRTRLLQEIGDCTLHDTLLNRSFTYDVDSFFQVNVPMFERALERMKEYCTEPELTDMYAGVGSIGLSVATRAVDMVELDPATAAMARVNAKASDLVAEVLEMPAEKSLEYILDNKPVIFDPPRAGLHDHVIDRILEVKPPKIVYLSCNPVTQARDLTRLQELYKIDYFEAFNFFPRTPHIETLAIIVRI